MVVHSRPADLHLVSQPVCEPYRALLAETQPCQESGLPAALKTTYRLHHGAFGLNFSISPNLPSKFRNRDPRDSSDHCSTN